MNSISLFLFYNHPFRYILKKFPSKVKLKRLRTRNGLIKARLVGAELATGDVLMFLDSHCECGYDWVQPLLQRIKEEPRAFVVPIIDVIDDKTMEYYHGNGVYFQIGGFTWSGHFNWIDIPEVCQWAPWNGDKLLGIKR